MIATVAIAACPLCAGTLQPLGIAQDFDVKALGERVTIEYALCDRCRFVCQNRVLPFDALMRYYSDSPKLREAVPTETDSELHVAQSAFMQRSGELNGRRVLDIGADMGKFLDYLATTHGCATFYQEENQTARAWLAASGRHTEAADAAACPPFDWIVMSQLLEHVVDPIPMLERMRDALGPAGKLFIEVPHHGMWDDRDIGFFFEHVNYFSPATLSSALDRAGYHLLALEVTTDAHYFDGRCRIIRACAQPREAALLGDVAVVVREHEHRQTAVRSAAVIAHARAAELDGRPSVALYGAADLARYVLREVTGAGHRVAAIFDTDTRKHGRAFGSLTILHPERIVDVDPAAIVIVSSAEADIRRTIEQTGYRGRILCWSEL